MPRISPLAAALTLAFVLVSQSASAATAWSIDQDGDGYITRKELYAHLTMRHGARDRNHDGFLQAYELTGRFVGGSTPFTNGQAASFMASFDLDRDARVSAHEMVQAIEYSATFDRFDTNDDGRLSATETRALGFIKAPAKRSATMPGFTPDD